MAVQKLIKLVRNKIKIKTSSSTCIDNWVFKLHYYATTLICLISVLLVSSGEYVGERMNCILDSKDRKFQHFIETFCFIGKTFTVTNTHSTKEFYFEQFYSPGILPHEISPRRSIKKHIYYQWVPFVLFGQAIMFCLTHLCWKGLEEGRIGKLASSLTHSDLAILDKELKINGETISTHKQKEECIERIKTAFLQRRALNKSWASWFVFFEIMNLLNVILQIYITDQFLGKQFYKLGFHLLRKGPKILDKVFPKMTRCIFHKFGRGGSIQTYDSLCVMGLNIIHEKIYVFLWFWFVFLFLASCLIIIWRFITIVLYCRSNLLNRLAFGYAGSEKYPWHLKSVLKHCSYSDWLFLKYLSKNMPAVVFKDLFDKIIEEISEKNFVSYWNDGFN